MQSQTSVCGLMFSSQPGTTALRPSLPSQERDWTSVFIQSTHIPQDQGSTADAATSSGLSQGHIPQDQKLTAGAATSSGLSQGRASRLWWQSREVQWEELLDAVTVETAEVKPESEETN
jgi:hypothetical protein